MIAEADDVNADLFFLKTLREFFNFTFVSNQWRANEQDDSHLVVLSLTMFQNELRVGYFKIIVNETLGGRGTYMSNSDASDKIHVSVGLNQVHLGHDCSYIASECC